MDISMDIHAYIHIHRRLTCVHAAPNFCKKTAVQEHLSPVKNDTNIPTLYCEKK